MNYEIVPYEPAFREQLVALRSDAHQADPEQSRRYLDWKYERNPFLADPIFYLALSGGKPIAMRGMYGTCWEAGPLRERFVIPSADDFVVAQEHRNSGVVGQLMRAAVADLAHRGFEYVISTSAGRITALSSLTMGWKSAGMVEPVARFQGGELWRRRFRRRIQGRRVVWRFALESQKDRLGPTTPFERLDRSDPRTVSNGVVVFETSPRAEAMAELHLRLGRDDRIRHVRDAAYFSWRYDNPLRECRFAFLEADGRLAGYLALARWRTYREPVLAFTLSDWEATSAEVFETLLSTTLACGGFSEMATWTTTLSHETRAVLARAGFVPFQTHLRARGLPCVLVRSLTGLAHDDWRLGGKHLLDPKDWDLRILQSAHG